ncbi:MAG TPA: hypothetical protein GX521_04185, partial [Firmicutes bacterium]|nr:hypothetical protein [Bacillota bacterium]
MTKWILVLAAFLIMLGGSSRLQASPVWSDRFEQTLGKGAVPEIIKQYGGEYTTSSSHILS